MYSGSSKRQISMACLDHLTERLHVLDELGEDAEAALGGLVEQDVGRLRIAHRDDADFVRLDLEDASRWRA